MRCRWSTCCLIVFAALSQTALGQDVVRNDRLSTPPETVEEPLFGARASGAIRFDYFRSNRLLDDKSNFYGATLQGKLDAVLASGVDAKIDARATNPDASDKGDTDASLVEGYVTMRSDQWRVRAGKQIVPWGRTDAINPTDNLTPRDYVVLLPFDEDQRIGTTALTVDRYLSDELTLSVFTTPYFEPSKIPFPENQVVFVEQRPPRRLSKSEIGARINKAGGGIDWSASYFHGYSLLPDFRPIGISPAGIVLQVDYGSTDIFGLDFATNVGRYGFRGEMAYVATSDVSGMDPFGKNPYWFYVIGGDRTFDGSLNINIQLFGRHVRNYSDPEDIADPIQRSIAVLNAIINSQQDRNTYGITARISKKWLNDTLKAEIFAVVNLTRDDSYLRPLITYDATDHVSLTVGADLYRGLDNTFFGRLKLNRGAFAEVRYSF